MPTLIAAKMAAQWWADRLEQGDKAAFMSTLIPLIVSDLETDGKCQLKCDYDPQDHLLTAVQAAGVECAGVMFSARGILPMKTALYVYPDRLRPKEGYGNWVEEIPVTGTD